MTGSLFRKEALQYQRERLWGEVTLAQPISVHVMSIAVAIILVGLILFLCFGTYTRKQTVPGYLVPSTGLVDIHSPQPGTVRELLVRPGDTVQAGDVLLRVHTGRTLTGGLTLSTMLADLLLEQKRQTKARIDRHLRQRDARRRHIKTSILGLEKKIEQLERQSDLQQKRVALAESQYHALESLHQDSLISEEDYQSRYQTVLNERQRTQQIEQTLLSETARLNDVRFELNSLDSEAQETTDQLRAEVSRIDQQLLRNQGDQGFSIKAPSSGVVTSLQVDVGQVVDGQRPLLTLLPEGDPLQAVLLIPTEGIGFVEPELPVKIRYDAFPYERFGIQTSLIERVARTILAPHEVKAPLQLDRPVYRATATLLRQSIEAYGRSMPLQAGMTFQADILLDERPLYQWILKPLYSLKRSL